MLRRQCHTRPFTKGPPESERTSTLAIVVPSSWVIRSPAWSSAVKAHCQYTAGGAEGGNEGGMKVMLGGESGEVGALQDLLKRHTSPSLSLSLSLAAALTRSLNRGNAHF